MASCGCSFGTRLTSTISAIKRLHNPFCSNARNRSEWDEPILGYSAKIGASVVVTGAFAETEARNGVVGQKASRTQPSARSKPGRGSGDPGSPPCGAAVVGTPRINSDIQPSERDLFVGEIEAFKLVA
jgi:hypothetical protein